METIYVTVLLVLWKFTLCWVYPSEDHLSPLPGTSLFVQDTPQLLLENLHYLNSSLYFSALISACICPFLSDSELWWLGLLFSLSLCHPESIFHTSYCQVMVTVSCRSDWQTTETPKMPLCFPAPCLSWSSSSLNHAQSLTHTNTWAHRAIISPAIYFKRTCSPRKKTHAL